MNILLDSVVAANLLAMTIAARGDEFSGFGYCERDKKTILIYDFELCNVGSTGYTEIPAAELLRISKRKDRKKMKAWIHRHPVGNGTPGAHNWSGRDNKTILDAPLGGPPELIEWSVSVVITPSGWVGRIDNHKSKKTIHVDVLPEIKSIYLDILAFQDKKKKVVYPKKLSYGPRKWYKPGSWSHKSSRSDFIDDTFVDDDFTYIDEHSKAEDELILWHRIDDLKSLYGDIWENLTLDRLYELRVDQYYADALLLYEDTVGVSIDQIIGAGQYGSIPPERKQKTFLGRYLTRGDK